MPYERLPSDVIPPKTNILSKLSCTPAELRVSQKWLTEDSLSDDPVAARVFNGYQIFVR
jgi:hypothetical protein